MEEIIKRLGENRRVERSKKILENAGYSVGRTDEGKEFKVGDRVSFSPLFGGSKINAKVVAKDADSVTLRQTWTSEDTGESVTEEETYPLEVQDGTEAIQIWEYHGKYGYAYPPVVTSSTIGESARASESKKLKESTYNRMEFPTEAEAREYAEENGLEIAKTQDCESGCVAWFRKFDYNPAQEREKLPEAAQLATDPISSEEKQSILAIFEKTNMDVIDTREEQDQDEDGVLMNLFVVACDNSNPTYLGWCQSDLREYCEPQDIDFWSDSNDNGFYGRNYYFYKYLEDAE